MRPTFYACLLIDYSCCYEDGYIFQYQIEWSIDDLTNATDVGIDFGDDLDTIDFGNEAIDFGEDEISLVDTADICIEEDAPGIDYGIETLDESEMQKPNSDDSVNTLGKCIVI